MSDQPNDTTDKPPRVILHFDLIEKIVQRHTDIWAWDREEITRFSFLSKEYLRLFRPMIYRNVNLRTVSDALQFFSTVCEPENQYLAVLSGPVSNMFWLQLRAALGQLTQLRTFNFCYKHSDTDFLVRLVNEADLQHCLPATTQTLHLKPIDDEYVTPPDDAGQLLEQAPWDSNTWRLAISRIPSIRTLIVSTPCYLIWPPTQERHDAILQEWTAQLRRDSSSLSVVVLNFGYKDEGYAIDDWPTPGNTFEPRALSVASRGVQILWVKVNRKTWDGKKITAPSPSSREEYFFESCTRRSNAKQREEFRQKYRSAFPSWTFYFDIENIAPENQSKIKLASAKVRQLGGSIEDFFSNTITHLITDQLILAVAPLAKENRAFGGKFLKNPNGLKGPVPEEFLSPAVDLVSKAKSFRNTKIWNSPKLLSVVERCLDFVPTSASNVPSAPRCDRTLSRLLCWEKIHGISERDPTQKRHDFKYFKRGTYFMLVEDIRDELATVAVQEYVIPKGRDATNTSLPWPVLHCHPHARGPFLPFDEKEKERWEIAQRLQGERATYAHERQQVETLRMKAMNRTVQACVQACNQSGDLRRSVSMDSVHSRAKAFDEQQFVDMDGDGDDDSSNTGYLPRVFVAESGSSVGITSTTGTTFTTGFSLGSSALPSSLRSRPEVLTSGKFTSAHTQERNGNMGLPTHVPGRQPVFKVGRSADTKTLPRSDEGSKPDYCECCRTKFEDFNAHITGPKHRKFAVDNVNYLHLDFILYRVRRRTVEEVRQEEAE
ncbi:DBF4-type domain-containing protein [Mycena sanguinolenta]|uniref:DBF4-type domain-containing protein n=1 Tax=Mycena sanguinolenta TaxID=230812 RepID=A0A8H6X832_9AGAR|nr:DBF4-type domain-containing protein [Mycena sanguinolenta]